MLTIVWGQLGTYSESLSQKKIAVDNAEENPIIGRELNSIICKFCYK